MKYPTMTRTGAVASGGITPASGERKTQSRNSTPVTTDASPVRPPSPIPEADSMNVVFDDALAAPPAAAATESTSRTRFMFGSLPSSSSRPASSPSPTAVPIVSKKSDSMTANTGTIAAQNPSVAKNPNEKFPSETEVGRGGHGIRHLRDPRSDGAQIALSPQIPLMIAAITVVADDRRSGDRPATFRTTRIEQSASPIANVRIRSVVKFVVIAERRVPGPRTTTPAFTSPMIVEEQADPDRDRPLQVHRDRVQDAFRKPGEHEERDDEPLDHDHAHRLGPGEPLPGDERERDERVQPEPRGDRERVVRPEAHREGHDARRPAPSR